MYRFHPLERVSELIAAAPSDRCAVDRSFRLPGDDIRLQKARGRALMDVGCYCVNVSRTLASAERGSQAFAHWAESGVDARCGTLRFERTLAQFDCALTLERAGSTRRRDSTGILRWAPRFFRGQRSRSKNHGQAGRSVHTLPGADECRLMVEHFADSVLEDERCLSASRRGEPADDRGALPLGRTPGDPESVG
jgi:hypothetical protein